MSNNTAAATISVVVSGVLLPGATTPNTRVGKATHAVAVTLGNGQTKVTTFHTSEAMAIADAAAVVAKQGRYATASVAAWYAAKGGAASATVLPALQVTGNGTDAAIAKADGIEKVTVALRTAATAATKAPAKRAPRKATPATAAKRALASKAS